MKNDINLEDLETAYSYKSNKELKFTHFIFSILQNQRLVKLLIACTNGILKYNLPFKFLIKKTVFNVFCAGEDINKAFSKINYLETYKVKSVLDYVSEAENSDEFFENNTKIIVANIIKLGKECPGNYVSVKITGLEDPKFLTYRNAMDLENESIISPRFDRLIERINLICKTAYSAKVIVFIDAEDRCMQDLFDKITESMMQKYNKEYAVVFNTLQMYLKDRLKYLNTLIEEAGRKNYIPGIKLVRGAYVEKEREKARKEGKTSPVFDTKKETDDSFNQAVEICLREFKKVDSCIATHNNDSTLHAINCINKYNITNHYSKVRFSQLYGMSDNLTFNLSVNGYNSSKYLPYGEVKKAIPYLIRRSEENSSIDGQIIDEVVRLKKEIERRNKL
ncbi:MAG: proline dehydrogenase family protein [Sphingobacteriaceae bacterium]|nr:proline dehydrogenase family protein [Sphingobacteriaceae bacterium]MBP8032956.1 proline dehydrogenase family protein [Bacteroidia bacterium]